MGIFDNEYQYGEDEYINKRLRRILRVNPNYLDYFRLNHGRYPRGEEINQEYSNRSVAGQFYWLNDSGEEMDIWLEKRNLKYRRQQEESGDIGFWASLGGLIGAFGALMFEENPEFYDNEDDYYEDEDDY